MTDIFDMMAKQASDTFTVRGLKSIIDNEALAYAMYTVENRAIPNMIDGLKPVQRFVVARALELGKGNRDKFHKLASIAGGVADLGYHHGEGSAQDAGALMANTWNNNYPILDGQGNFGSRLVQEAAASRYIFARVGKTSLMSIRTLSMLRYIKIKNIFLLLFICLLFLWFFSMVFRALLPVMLLIFCLMIWPRSRKQCVRLWKARKLLSRK